MVIILWAQIIPLAHICSWNNILIHFSKPVVPVNTVLEIIRWVILFWKAACMHTCLPENKSLGDITESVFIQQINTVTF